MMYRAEDNFIACMNVVEMHKERLTPIILEARNITEIFKGENYKLFCQSRGFDTGGFLYSTQFMCLNIKTEDGYNVMESVEVPLPEMVEWVVRNEDKT